MMNKIHIRNHQYLLITGAILLAVVVLLDVFVPDDNYPTWISLVLVIAGGTTLLAGLVLQRRTEKSTMDERFILHRLKSSRVGLIVGLLAALGFILFRVSTGDTMPLELVAVICAMAVGKVAAMVYFRLTA